MQPAQTPRFPLSTLLLSSLVVVGGAAAALWVAGPHPCPTAVAGYQPMEVVEVAPLGGGYAVRLGDGHARLTMFVGASEGLAIRLHRDGLNYPRPLSMDLMGSALQELGAELVDVRVDSIRDTAYIGSLHLRQGTRWLELDARPSDAIALALAQHVPILVADPVIAAARDF
jgi:bifunctional DNase/RNase